MYVIIRPELEAKAEYILHLHWIKAGGRVHDHTYVSTIIFVFSSYCFKDSTFLIISSYGGHILMSLISGVGDRIPLWKDC